MRIPAGLKLSNWPFAVKMAVPASLALLGGLVLALFGAAEIRGQTGLLGQVVGQDLPQITKLSLSAAELQAVNGGIYRLVMLHSVQAAGLDLETEVTALTTRVGAIQARLTDITGSPGSASRHAQLVAAGADLALYRSSVRTLGWMLDGDLPGASTQLRLFDDRAQHVLRELSQLTDDSAHAANARAAESARSARMIYGLFLTVGLVMGGLVMAASAFITRRTVGSMRRIARATRLVAQGEQALQVERLARHDELGDIVESLKAFQSNNARISFMAHHDALTSLPNRVLFQTRVELALEQAARGRPCALHCLDLDQFKAVNDTLGHPVGDALLRSVAGRLKNCLREGDTVARLGGDEFAIIQPGVGAARDAGDLAQRLVQVIGAPYEINGHQLIIGTSVGVAVSGDPVASADTMMRHADTALYRAKTEGRGTWRFFEPDMDEVLQQRRLLELDMRAALLHGQFEMYYQPLVNVKSREVSGFEALIRWNHPARGMVSPADFIPLAEETGLIVQIGAWALHQACSDAVAWKGTLKVAVNLSPLQFKDRHLVATVQHALTESGLPAWRLELEITEGVLLQESEATLATLHKLRDMNIRISMDDFGTGYSSLSYLRSFPFDKIKIDQSFIRDLADHGESAAIVRAVTGLSSSLGIFTTAEGVETEEQLARLVVEGCTEVQGYLFSPPRPASEVARLVAEISSRPAVGLVAVPREAETRGVPHKAG